MLGSDRSGLALGSERQRWQGYEHTEQITVTEVHGVEFLQC